jgi:acid phosphatase (class A)
MVRRFLSPLAAGGLIFASFAFAQPGPAPLTGYLNADTTPQTLRILPPPPPAGSGREADDEAIFAKTRALAGTPRWTLATADADMHAHAAMFACALRVRLGASDAPNLDRLFRRTSLDAAAITRGPKDHFARPRPYVVAAGDPPICVPKTDLLAKQASYPSGEATLGWAWGLILAEIAPERATEILSRAREIGESRIVCGVHYPSDVEAGRTNGAALVAALHADPVFEADLARARNEVAAARAAPHPAPKDCAGIEDAESHPF